MNDILDMPDDWKIAGHDELAGMPTEDKGLIITGLGGDGKLLRYFVVIPASKHTLLKPSFKTKVNTTFKSLFAQTEAKVEKITISPDHIRLMLLINMDNSVDEIVIPFIQKINFDSAGLLEHYLVVNTQIPSEDDVRKYVKETKSL